MNEHDRKAIAAMVAEILANQQDAHARACPNFTPEDVAAIKGLAARAETIASAITVYGYGRRLAFWAGAAVGVSILTAAGGGLCWVVWLGFKHAVAVR